MKVANWITVLATDVAEKNNIEVPLIEARKITSAYSGLTTTEGEKRKIIIRYSSTTPMWQKKLVVLHELAHCIMPLREHHSEAFWLKAFELYKEYNLPIRKVMQNEKGYRAAALFGYRNVQGLKYIKLKRKKHLVDSPSKLRYYSIIGIKKAMRRSGIQHWAVTEERGEMWRGIKITASLYKRLEVKKTYPII